VNLILANSEDLVIGKSPPWPLYDKDYNVLLPFGEIIRDKKHRGSLLADGACYELSWKMPGKEDGDKSISFVDDAISGQSGEGKTDKSYTVKNYTFDDMKLKVGDRLNLELPSDYDFRLGRQPPNERFLVKVIGFLKGASLLVTAPTTNNVALIGGKKVVMRSFSGQNAFGFACNIERICKVPYGYLHLSFPDEIQGTMVRKAPRVKASIIATVQSSKAGAQEQISSLISDISANGASIDAKKQLGDKGDILNLSFRVPLHNIEAYLSVKGVIRAVFSGGPDDAQKNGLIRHGIEFQELQPNDSVILQSMIYQQMIENPHKLV